MQSIASVYRTLLRLRRKIQKLQRSSSQRTGTVLLRKSPRTIWEKLKTTFTTFDGLVLKEQQDFGFSPENNDHWGPKRSQLCKIPSRGGAERIATNQSPEFEGRSWKAGTNSHGRAWRQSEDCSRRPESNARIGGARGAQGERNIPAREWEGTLYARTSRSSQANCAGPWGEDLEAKWRTESYITVQGRTRWAAGEPALWDRARPTENQSGDGKGRESAPSGTGGMVETTTWSRAGIS